MKDNERIKFMGRDRRGAVWAFTINEDPLEEVLLFFTKKGGARGGDYHSKRQYNFILKGTMKFMEMENIGTLMGKRTYRDETTVMNQGDFKAFEPNTPHMCISLTDSWMIEFHELPKTRRIYLPYRELVEKTKKELT